MTSTRPETRAVHITAPALPNSRPISVPLYQASNFAFDDPDALAAALNSPDSGFVYSRYANPTTRALEDTLAALENGVGAVATASGMGAINSALLALLSSGDHVIAQRCIYGGAFASLNDLAARFGVEVTYIPGEDPAEVEKALRPNTRLLYLETIANPVTRVINLPTFLAAGKAANLTTLVDNTFATPLLCQPLTHGADIVLHSATKYLGGHSDITGGILAFATEELHHKVWHYSMELGAMPDPFAAWLTIRGIQTLPVRMRQHCANAALLAHRLTEHPAVTAVHWPGLASHPDHQIAKELLADFGGMIAFELAGGRAAGHAFSKGVRVVQLAASLGGVESTVLHPASTSHRQLNEQELAAAGIGAGMVRLSVGIEHAEDLWADIDQALPA
ncbi:MULTISPECIES: PLP-dependent aspartate aminotransferase family protein [unclassified Crossiella]|uniref:trans-sulfuration enzyme family protein n=1 Tax=unclassified Crossiella TaxID=2620835 RepID=UPI001FFFB169|nr:MULTISPECIES: aminotransferase class I/II-fold pyridoxal phosphate-dependent enzyme [unclassified Crossiella]MCK2242076.1 aminotransferase class I/II-fold pyridoxal phosphate-dependent enzyme [Crossiella sp. S99.2]MCK2255979.1 aminotransferase class I/II-fold pyridoxal phosphate-dependent enzyme [Crossiella sp. S99.1]